MELYSGSNFRLNILLAKKIKALYLFENYKEKWY